MQGSSLPTMNALLDFLHSRRKVLETDKYTKGEKSDQTVRNTFRAPQATHTVNRKPYGQSENNRNLSSYATHHAKPFCHLCKGSHFTQYCERLVKETVPERSNIVKKANLCFNCLKSNHTMEECRSSRCKLCDKKHHSLLHVENEISLAATHVHAISLKNNVPSENLITTAVIHILDKQRVFHECRVLLDSCSQPHLLTNRMV